MTTTAVDNDGNPSAAAANAGAATHRQRDCDVEARLAGVKALLDQTAGTLKTLHGAPFFSARPNVDPRAAPLLTPSALFP